MPIYEYRCQDCRRRSSLFVRTVASPVDAVCGSCGGRAMDRLVSSFAVHRGEASRLADLDTSREPDADYYRDPRNIGLSTRKRLQEMGAADLVPQLDEVIEKGRSGAILDD